jgi:hypothetical protein
MTKPPADVRGLGDILLTTEEVVVEKVVGRSRADGFFFFHGSDEPLQIFAAVAVALVAVRATLLIERNIPHPVMFYQV